MLNAQELVLTKLLFKGAFNLIVTFKHSRLNTVLELNIIKQVL